MDEFYKFLAVLRKYKWVLIIVPIAAILVTYFLVRSQPNTYISQAQLSTGIADDKQNTVFNQSLPGDQVNQEFANLIEMVKMKKVLDQVSYLLILNDLNSQKVFREPSSLMKTVNEDARRHAAEVIQVKYNNAESLNPNDPDQLGMINLIQSMRYDSGSIGNSVSAMRSGSSDFLIIQAESDGPELSAFIANNVSTEFIKNYSNVVKQNQHKAINYLNELLVQRTDTLSKRMTDLRSYKIRNRVLNLDEQSKQLYTSILEYETKKQDAIQTTSSYAGALNEIDNKFNPSERKYLESAISKVNQDIASIKNEISSLYDAQLQSDFEPRYQVSMDSLNVLLDQKIHQASDQYLVNPLASKQELMAQKIRLEIQLDLSRYSMNALENELNRLNLRFDNMVPKEADVQTLEMNVDIATKAYMDILNKYNETNLEAAFSLKLNIIQNAIPGSSQPSKKMLLILLSGVISVALCLVFLFVLYYLDNTVRTSTELANKTGIAVLGGLNYMNHSTLSLREIWNDQNVSSDLMHFKNQLRSIRYEIERDLIGNVVVLTSLTPLEGKSFICMNLAAALMVTYKKILIIDGNFLNSSISTDFTSNLYLEDFMKDRFFLERGNENASITILKNKGGDNSLVEVTTEEKIKDKLKFVKSIYDLILIDTTALSVSNQAKEWISQADVVVGIFRHGKILNERKMLTVKFLKETQIFKGWILNKQSHSDKS
ncbi:exopolysaccharide transport family protein [Pedobacter sp. JCM 36344]|uniref:exopolysaccharide transport family protein n=1 Tax=Pedobacter sp. JCM 36344 TaxID=3374280 RepID=UPI00397E008A